MFTCPSCGDNLLFDIPSQQLKCCACSTQYDPYQFETKKSDGIEGVGFDGDSFEATIFSCPQCGGEILSTDNASAGFCSFCGASTILYTRLANEKRPGYVIPFKKTKADCKESFAAMMKKAIFAPSEYKDPSKIDSFRGIYMPYWAFHVEQTGDLSFFGTKSHRQGDYIITDNYQLTGSADCYYKGISYDASSSFADSISEAIAPYDVKGMKEFTPSYLSGFYADTSDVDAKVYEPLATSLATAETKKAVRASFSGFTLSEGTLDSQIKTQVKDKSLALFPVWFMSYRSGDRVAYATVNGQTGKVVADLPVDPKKYLKGSLLLALPIFLLLCLMFTPTTTTQMFVCAIVTVIASIITNVEIAKIIKHETSEDDIGVIGAKDAKAGADAAQKKASTNAKIAKAKNTSSGAVKVIKTVVLFYVISVAFSMLFAILSGIGSLLLSGGNSISTSGFAWSILILAQLVIALIGIAKSGNTPHHNGTLGLFIGTTAVVLGGALMMVIHSNLVVALNQYEDIIYYVMSLVMSASVAVSFMDIIKSHNVLATRRLPQFDKKGGDDRA